MLIDGMRCNRCSRPATTYVNVNASAASSVPSRMEPRCDHHNLTGTTFQFRVASTDGAQSGGIPQSPRSEGAMSTAPLSAD